MPYIPEFLDYRETLKNPNYNWNWSIFSTYQMTNTTHLDDLTANVYSNITRAPKIYYYVEYEEPDVYYFPYPPWVFRKGDVNLFKYPEDTLSFQLFNIYWMILLVVVIFLLIHGIGLKVYKVDEDDFCVSANVSDTLLRWIHDKMGFCDGPSNITTFADETMNF